jgi:hypothetical protein
MTIPREDVPAWESAMTGIMGISNVQGIQLINTIKALYERLDVAETYIGVVGDYIAEERGQTDLLMGHRDWCLYAYPEANAEKTPPDWEPFSWLNELETTDGAA